MSTFKINVESLLETRGWSIKDLADEMGMDRSNLSKVIRGIYSPTLAMVDKIATAFDVPAHELIQPCELVS